jgi:hypothetical protein
LKNAHTRKSATAAEPVLVGSASRTGRGDNRPGSFCELEIRIKLTPTQARLLRYLPIVGGCVRHNRVPLSAGDWRPHPTAPGVDIQFGAA